MSPKLLNILLIILPAVLYYGVFDPMYNPAAAGMGWKPTETIGSLQAKNINYVDALNTINDIQTQSKKLNDDYQALAKATTTNGGVSTTTKLAIMLPDTIDPIKLRNEILSIANRSGVEVSGISVKEDLTFRNPTIGSYAVVITLTSRYLPFKSLIAEYTKSMLFLNLKSMSITKVSEDALKESLILDKNSLNIAVTYQVYYLKQ